MKGREFNKLLAGCRKERGKNKGKLDPAKISALDSTTKEAMLRFIVRCRGPIMVEFLSELSDLKWLESCSYFHRTTGASGYTFLHTSEHTIK